MAASWWSLLAVGGCSDWWVDGATLERTVTLTREEPATLRYRSTVELRTEWDFWFIIALPEFIRAPARSEGELVRASIIQAVAISSIPEAGLDPNWDTYRDYQTWFGAGERDGRWESADIPPYRPPGTLQGEDTITLELTLEQGEWAEVDLSIFAHTSGQGPYFGPSSRREANVTLEWVE